MKKIIGLAVALVVILGIGFGLTTKADEITVDDHNINQDEYVKDEGTKAEEEIPVDSEVEVEDEVDTADVDKAPAKEEAVTEAPDTTETYQFERSEEHTSELQSRFDLVCRLLLEKKKQKNKK